MTYPYTQELFGYLIRKLASTSETPDTFMLYAHSHGLNYICISRERYGNTYKPVAACPYTFFSNLILLLTAAAVAAAFGLIYTFLNGLVRFLISSALSLSLSLSLSLLAYSLILSCIIASESFILSHRYK